MQYADDWLNIFLLLVNEHENKVGGGIYRNSNPIDSIDEHALGEDDIGAPIINHVEGTMDVSAIFSLRRWPISRVFNGAYSLLQHHSISAIRLQAQQQKEGKWEFDMTMGLLFVQD